MLAPVACRHSRSQLVLFPLRWCDTLLQVVSLFAASRLEGPGAALVEFADYGRCRESPGAALVELADYNRCRSDEGFVYRETGA
jgi:hypothetical protein